jgi:hypothetical protein
MHDGADFEDPAIVSDRGETSIDETLGHHEYESRCAGQDGGPVGDVKARRDVETW